MEMAQKFLDAAKDRTARKRLGSSDSHPAARAVPAKKPPSNSGSARGACHDGAWA